LNSFNHKEIVTQYKFTKVKKNPELVEKYSQTLTCIFICGVLQFAQIKQNVLKQKNNEK